MSRWVEPRRAGLASADELGSASGAAERVVKYIPAEVLVAYTALISGLGATDINEEQQLLLAALLMGVFFIATVVRVCTGAPEGGVRRAHLVVSPIAFLAWSYSISAWALGSWFFPAAAFALVAVTVGLSIMLVPKEY